jgi:hypothetical protein
MASPASSNISLFDSVGASSVNNSGQTYIGERDAVKLAFNDSGTVVNEGAAANNHTMATAQALGALPSLYVPNTLPQTYLILSGATAGTTTFTLTVNNGSTSVTTGNIAYTGNAATDAAAITSALDTALAGIGASATATPATAGVFDFVFNGLPGGTLSAAITSAAGTGTATIGPNGGMIVKDAGQQFNVRAIDVVGALVPDPNNGGRSTDDYYSFAGKSGQDMTFQVMSAALTRVTHPIDSVLYLYDYSGHLLATNDDDFESTDSSIVDFVLPTDGTYYVRVDSFNPDGGPDLNVGQYELFMYSFAAGGVSQSSGSTLVGGSGNDTLIADSGDVVFQQPANAGAYSIYRGSGRDQIYQALAPGQITPTGQITIVGNGGGGGTIQQFAVPSSFPAPNLTVPTSITVNAGDIAQFTAVASDASPSDKFTYSLVPGQFPTGASIDPNTGLFQWSPPQSGNYTVQVRVTDLSNNQVTQSVTINVQPAPTTTTVGGPAVTYNADGMVTVGVSSNDGVPTGSISLSVDGGSAVTQTLTGGSATFDVGSLNAGGHSLLATYATQGNFAGSSGTGTFTVNQAVPTLVLSGGSFTFDNHTHAASATATGVTNQTVSGSFSFTYNAQGTAPTLPGTYSVVATFTSTDTNYENGTATGTLTITPAPTATGITAPAVTYGTHGSVTIAVTDTAAIPVTPSGSVLLSVDGGAPVSGTLNAQGLATFDVGALNAGSHSLSASFAAQGNFSASGATASLVINQAAPTVSVTGGTFTYDGATHGATASATGAFGESLTPVSIGYNTSDASVPVNAGSYIATASYAGNTNYQAVSSAAAITINAAPTSLAISAPAVNYGAHGLVTITVSNTANAALPVGAVTLSVDGGSALTGTLAGGSYTFDVGVLGVGSHSLSAGYAAQGNFAASNATSSLTANKVAPTIVLTSGSFVYDGNSHAATASATGVFSESLPVTISYNTKDGLPPTVAGTYLASASFAGNSNYLAASTSAALNIAAAPTSLAISAPGITYGQHGFVTLVVSNTATSPTPSGTVTLSVDGGAAVSGTLTNGSATFDVGILGAGSHSLSAGYAAQGNFGTSNSTSALAVAQATPKVNITGGTFTYDSNSHAATASAVGALNEPLPVTIGYSPGGAAAPVNIGGYTTTASFAGNANYVAASKSTTITITAAPTATAISAPPVTYNAHGLVTVSVSNTATSPTPTGAVTLRVDGGSALTGTLSGGSYTFDVGVLDAGHHGLTANYAAQGNFAASGAATSSLIVGQAATTTTLKASSASLGFGQAEIFTATVTSAVPTPIGSVDFVDTTTGVDLGTFPLSGGSASVTVMNLPGGNQSIVATYSGATDYIGSTSQAATVNVNPSIIVLNGSAAGALTLSGNAQIKVTGVVEVDSNSTTALNASGYASISAAAIQVVGKTQATSTVHLSPAPTSVAAFSDPLINLPAPKVSVTGTPPAVNVSANSVNITAGVYSSITVSGTGKLNMGPGVYVITGGGFSVTGSGSVTGNGVMIYNAGSNYLGGTGTPTYGSVNISGNGAINLTPASTGIYAGILIFQARDNAKPLALSGNAVTMPGAVYVPNTSAAVTLSGNAQAASPTTFVVNTLNVSGNSILNQLGSATGTVYGPDQVRTAYGINSLTLDGTGQTIAVVDAYDNPAIFQELDLFDSEFSTTTGGSSLYQTYGPSSQFLTVLNQQGQTSGLPGIDPLGPGVANWEMETALDVEWIHAIAPGARIVLVEANSQSLADLMSSVATAASQPGVSVVSMSWGFTEGQAVLAQDEALYDKDLTTPAGHQGVTFVASTGDFGTANPEYPAFSPNVVAVGGTSLNLSSDNSYQSETGFGHYANGAGSAYIGGGGGLSQYEAEPAFQLAVQSTGYRTTPDVSMIADPATGAWVADTYNESVATPWEVVGGTSLSAPNWAGLFALANQGRALAGKATFNSTSPTETQQALYNVPVNDFHDITTGNNGYSAAVGYDLVTGLGSPSAGSLIPDLVNYSGTISSQRSVTITGNGGPHTIWGGGAGGSMNVINVFNVELVSRAAGPETTPTPAPTAAVLGTQPAPRQASALTSPWAFAGPAATSRGAAITNTTAISSTQAGQAPILVTPISTAPTWTGAGLSSSQNGLALWSGFDVQLDNTGATGETVEPNVLSSSPKPTVSVVNAADKALRSLASGLPTSDFSSAFSVPAFDLGAGYDADAMTTNGLDSAAVDSAFAITDSDEMDNCGDGDSADQS